MRAVCSRAVWTVTTTMMNDGGDDDARQTSAKGAARPALSRREAATRIYWKLAEAIFHCSSTFLSVKFHSCALVRGAWLPTRGT